MSNSSPLLLSWRPGISQHLPQVPKIWSRGKRKVLLLITEALLKLINTHGCESCSSEVMCGFCIQIFFSVSTSLNYFPLDDDDDDEEFG